MADVHAWKEDAEGRYFEMAPGVRKDYAIDWTDWIGASDSLSAVEWTIPVGLTKVSQAEALKVASVMLESASAGTYSCTCKLTTGAGLSEKIFFRVVVA